jgi:hypothetical protein
VTGRARFERPKLSNLGSRCQQYVLVSNLVKVTAYQLGLSISTETWGIMTDAREDTLVLSVALYTFRSNLCILIDSCRSILHSKRYLIYQNPLPIMYEVFDNHVKGLAYSCPVSMIDFHPSTRDWSRQTPIVPTFTHLHADKAQTSRFASTKLAPNSLPSDLSFLRASFKMDGKL